MPNTFKKLAQHSGAGRIEQILQCPEDAQIIVREIRVVNKTGSNAGFELYHDNADLVFDDRTAIEMDVNLTPNRSYRDKAHICMQPGEVIGFYGDVGTTITLYGVVIT